MSTEAKIETSWLQQLLGDWTYEFSTAANSEVPGATATGTEKVWAVGGTWIVAENKGNGSDGNPTHSVVTLGFDSARGRFQGVHAGTMAPVLFHFDGELGEKGKALLLMTEGPALSDDRATDKYRDILRMNDANHREQVSQVLDEHGNWLEFMSTRYTRKV